MLCVPRTVAPQATCGETSGETAASDLAFETRQIWLDLSRTGHPRFNRSADRTDLASVLLAYARRCPAYGWHPWRVLLAARLLLVGCDRETAFWCLVAIVEQLPGAAHIVGCYDLDDQHDDGARAVKREGLALRRLLRIAAPDVAAVFEQLDTSGAGESYFSLDMVNGGGASFMLGCAMRHLLLSPTDKVDSEALNPRPSSNFIPNPSPSPSPTLTPPEPEPEP